MLKDLVKKLRGREDLTAGEMQEGLEAILDGKVNEADIVGFLIALRDKGESSQEIRSAVEILRKKSVVLPCRAQDVMDTCGTGGDQKHTFNISTAAAFVVAGCGITVAKHGNRAVSSSSGSSDVLSALGVAIEARLETVARCVDEVGIGFLFAPLYHPALKAVASARKKIGTKTLFNILGPLLNPAGAKKQVIGVYAEHLIPVVIEVLRDLGTESAAVVAGFDGLDEVTLTTKTKISFLKDGNISETVFNPADVGYELCLIDDLKGGDAAENAKRLKQVLKGHSKPLDHCVHLNAALAIQVAGRADNFKDALLLAQESIASGRAFEKLEQLIEMSHA